MGEWQKKDMWKTQKELLRYNKTYIELFGLNATLAYFSSAGSGKLFRVGRKMDRAILKDSKLRQRFTSYQDNNHRNTAKATTVMV